MFLSDNSWTGTKAEPVVIRQKLKLDGITALAKPS